MEKKETTLLIPEEKIINKIFLLRDEKVMLDIHLAEIYGVETRALKQAVRRNIDLFPSDFMFILSETEAEMVVSQNVIPSKKHLGGSNPFAFTEAGVAMLSSVLKSKRAREMNIAIVRAFVTLRKMILTSAELQLAIQFVERKTDGNTKSIELLFAYMDQLMEKDERQKESGVVQKVGFKQGARK